MVNVSIKGNRQEKTYDLVIVGSGPSGSLAAARAAKAGLSVIMIERKKHPRLKTCGGFLSNRAISLLPEDLKLGSLKTEPVYQVSVIKNRKPYTFNSKSRLGIILKREDLDHLMVKYACKYGAELKEQESLRAINKSVDKNKNHTYYSVQLNNNITLKSHFIIGADGAFGCTASLAGIRKKRQAFPGWGLSQTFNTETAIAERGSLKFYPQPFLGGMGWSFSGPEWINQGVGGLSCKKILAKSYRQLFPPESEENSDHPGPQSWPLPFLGPLQNIASDNIILVGDAAGLVEPYSGEGLYNSLVSSHLAVHAILNCLAGIENKAKAAEIYRPLIKKQFFFTFFKTLIGSISLHVRSIIAPSTLPSEIAAMMDNLSWFSHSLDLSVFGRD
ncbi:MAG: geranylgeranyl reductase family protein [Bacillota bacterium]